MAKPLVANNCYRAVLLMKYGDHLGPAFRQVLFLEAESPRVADRLAREMWTDKHDVSLAKFDISVELVKFYPNTILELSSRHRTWFPDAEPICDTENIPNLILWMMDEMQNCPNTKEGSVRAAQFICWIIGFEEARNHIGHNYALALLQKDMEEGYF